MEARFSYVIHRRTYYLERKFKTHLSHVSLSSSLDCVPCVSRGTHVYEIDFANRDSQFHANAIVFPFLPSRRVTFHFDLSSRVAILRMITKKAADRPFVSIFRESFLLSVKLCARLIGSYFRYLVLRIERRHTIQDRNFIWYQQRLNELCEIQVLYFFKCI